MVLCSGCLGPWFPRSNLHSAPVCLKWYNHAIMIPTMPLRVFCEGSGENVCEEKAKLTTLDHIYLILGLRGAVQDEGPTKTLTGKMETAWNCLVRHLHERHRLTHGKGPSLGCFQTWAGESEPRRTKDEVQATQMDMLKTQSIVSHECMGGCSCGFPAAAKTTLL